MQRFVNLQRLLDIHACGYPILSDKALILAHVASTCCTLAAPTVSAQVLELHMSGYEYRLQVGQLKWHVDTLPNPVIMPRGDLEMKRLSGLPASIEVNQQS